MSILAPPYDEATILGVGQRGRFRESGFVLAGRICVRGSHQGALWNEWTLRFDDGRVAFLSEAGSRFTLHEEDALLSSWEDVVVGATLASPWLVVERGSAERVGTWGDVDAGPLRYRYVELSHPSGRRASIDFGAAPPRVFSGAAVALVDLGLSPVRPHPRLIPAPDVSRPAGVVAWLEPGDEGTLAHEGQSRVVRVLGLVARRAGGVAWQEYLLHDPACGVRWLVLEAGAFGVATSIDAGRVTENDAGASFSGLAYTAEPPCTAHVEWAAGELPWAVTIGAESRVRVFAATDASSALTKEWTDQALSWTQTVPIATERIAKAFGRRALPASRS